MRYKETGHVHLDFHRVANGTIAYLRKNYGTEFLDKVFTRMARDVYRSICQDLQAGDPEQLVEHWSYYFDREGGDYAIERRDGEIRMTVRRCPAIAHLKSKGIEIDLEFCRQTVVINQALAEGSPFEITTDVLGDRKCVQTIRRVRR